jgi:hypothetical protein
VTDNVRIATAPDSYNSDGIEIYIDVHGDKTINYGSDDHQIRINRGYSETVSERELPDSRIRSAQIETEDGYRVEVAISFDALSEKRREYDFVGFDIHVNDSDLDGRENKIAWFGTRDNAYQSPGRFGTLLLSRE